MGRWSSNSFQAVVDTKKSPSACSEGLLLSHLFDSQQPCIDGNNDGAQRHQHRADGRIQHDAQIIQHTCSKRQGYGVIPGCP